jgi:glycosyltransferase involved in cell wall biosynthesis
MQNKIKVLQIAASGITVKGLLLPLIDRLRQEGYAVHTACSDGPHTRELQARGYEITPIEIERRIAPLSNLRSVWGLYRLMRRQRFDVVHVHTPIAAVVGRVAARLAGVPTVIYTAHGFYFHDNMPRRVRTPLVWMEKLLGPITHMLLTQSGEDAATAVREKICHAERVQHIGNGVDIRRFAAAPDGADRLDGLSKDDRVVGFVGRMVAEKGILELIEAMQAVVKAVPNARLLLVGDTLDDDRDQQLKQTLRRMINESGLASRVVFTGFVQDVPRAMASMDVFVLPSYREGMPRTIIEAMACGRPVVATDIRGCREEVVHGVTGLLVPVKDPNALAQAIIQTLSDPQRARRMGEEGRRRAETLFDEEKVLDKQIEIYKRLVGARMMRLRKHTWTNEERDEAKARPGY